MDHETEKKSSEITRGKNGGARPGAGRPKGRHNKITSEVRQLAQKHTSDAINTLVNIMASGETDAARVAAAKEILDRGYGKAVQYSEIDANVYTAPPLSAFYGDTVTETDDDEESDA